MKYRISKVSMIKKMKKKARMKMMKLRKKLKMMVEIAGTVVKNWIRKTN